MNSVLIFTISLGGGHDAIASSLQTGLVRRGYDVRIIDAFGMNPALDNFAKITYHLLAEKLPLLYHLSYYRWDELTWDSELIFNALTFRAYSKILKAVKKIKPALLICTHAFAAYILSKLKDRGAFDLPILSFVTDYKVHGFYINPRVDAFIAPCEYTRKDMIKRGIPADRIYPFGIPLRERFYNGQRENHGIKKDPGEPFTILMMAGGNGSPRMKKAFLAVMKVRKPIHIIVVCGKNKSMASALKRKTRVLHDPAKKVDIYGFTDNVNELMDISDIIITKPGGITVTEAIAKGIPILIPFHYPAQEKENADYVTASGVGIKVRNMDELTSRIGYLIRNKHILREISGNMAKAAAGYSRESSLDLCETLIKQHLSRRRDITE